MKVWITGAGGMMGSHLAEMLQAAGHDVRATYYKPTIDPLELHNFEAVEVDITDWCSVYDSLAAFRPDVVFHLAAQSYPTASWERPVETLTSNVVGTAIVFEALRRLRPDAKVIVAGSSAEYGFVDPSEVPIKERRELRPLHPYGVSKVRPICWPANTTVPTTPIPSWRAFSTAPGPARSVTRFQISSAVAHGWSVTPNNTPFGSGI